MELFPTKAYKAAETSNIDNKQILFEKLQENKKAFGFSWFLSPDPLDFKNTLIASIKDIIFDDEFWKNIVH